MKVCPVSICHTRRSIYVLDVKNGYCRALRLAGHSSTIRSLDWSADGKYISSMDQAYESLIFDVSNGKVPKDTLRDERWLTRTNVLGFAVMGIWPDYSDGTDINAADRSPCGRYVLTSDDSGKVCCCYMGVLQSHAPYREQFAITALSVMKAAPGCRRSLTQSNGLASVTCSFVNMPLCLQVNLFCYPCIVDAAPHWAHCGHSSHVTSVRWNANGSHAISTGGKDHGVFIWKKHRRPERQRIRPSRTPWALDL